MLSSIFKNKTSQFSNQKIKIASKQDIRLMIDLCVKNLENKNFFKPKEKKSIMLENLKNMFYKMELSSKEIKILISIFSQINKN